MALTFITGGAGSGKTHLLLETLIRRSKEDPFRRIFLIVPEQYTMQTQRELVSLHPQKCIMNLEVTSLGRLAQRVFRETGFHGEELLEEIGKSFLLEKTALEIGDSLSFFRRSCAKPEYIAELKAVISELMLYDVTPEKLKEAAESGQAVLQQRAKLLDIAAVYASFRKKLEGNYMTMEEVPDKLCALAERSTLIRDSVIAFDGFTGFTPVQMRLLRKLLVLSKDVYTAVTVEPGRNPDRSFSGTDLFSMGLSMQRDLSKAAKEERVPCTGTIVVESGVKSRHAFSPALAHLEKYLFRKQEIPFSGTDDGLELWICRDPEAEVENAAGRILGMVRDEGLHFRDIAVIAGDPAAYSPYIRKVFSKKGIPCFIDEKKSLPANSLIEYARAAVSVCAENFSYESVFRMLKNPFSAFQPEETDRLENYCLGRGIQGKSLWMSDFSFSYEGENPAEVPELNLIRKRAAGLMLPLAETFSRRGSTVLEKSAALYDFLERSHVNDTLDSFLARFEQEGRMDLVREYSQVLPYLCRFLDRLVRVLGSERISMRDYAALLEAGFQEGKIAVIPSGNDRVLVGDMERSRIPEVKTLIFLGVNEGSVPKQDTKSGILTDHDREFLVSSKMPLKPFGRSAIAAERFYLYLALTKPSEKLIVSFSEVSAKGSSLRPSYVVDLLKRLFPGLEGKSPEEDSLDAVECPEDGLACMARLFREMGVREMLPPQMELYRWFQRSRDYSQRLQVLLEASRNRPADDQIGRAAAKALYGEVLVNSASRLERFCACEFRHFLDYGLKIRPRPAYEFTPLDYGTLMHRALELYAKRLMKEQEPVSGGEHLQIAREALEETLKEAGSRHVIHSSKRNEDGIRRMQRILLSSVDALRRMEEAGTFRIYDTEADFSDSSLSDLSSFDFSLPEGGKMYLRGKIDRIDTADDGDMTWVRIIDYKTGNERFDPARIYYGLSLQLAVYMSAALELLRKRGKNASAAGMFYYRIRDPLLKLIDGETDSGLLDRRMKEMAASGVLLGDRDVIGCFDRDFLLEGESKYFSVKVKKDGCFTASSNILNEEGFRVSSDYARWKAEKAGALILEGSARINPYRMGTETACDYCPYKAVCGFDPKEEGRGFRNLKKMSGTEAVEAMQEELG